MSVTDDPRVVKRICLIVQAADGRQLEPIEMGTLSEPVIIDDGAGTFNLLIASDGAIWLMAEIGSRLAGIWSDQ